MSADPARPRLPWPQASAALAARVRRRARRSAAFTRVGAALLIAAALALLWRAAGPTLAGVPGTLVVAAILGVGLLVGVVLAAGAARRAPRVGDDDAAWALDRLAQARGRGLAAAAARGPAAGEAAFGGDGLGAPPAVRLHPPGGLALVVGALLLAVLAVLAPERSAEAPGTPGTDGPRIAVSGEGDDGAAAAGRAEAEARALQARADAARKVREALSLPPDGPLDPREVAERLQDPEARRKAAEAAAGGPDLESALNGSETSGEAVARLIERGEDNHGAASQTRREAAAARARLGIPAVPSARRDVVQRYLELIDREQGG